MLELNVTICSGSVCDERRRFSWSLWRTPCHWCLDEAGRTERVEDVLCKSTAASESWAFADSLFSQWFQMAIWGLTAAGIQFGYQPPKRHTHLDQLSLWQKLARLDLAGTALFTTGLTLFLVGLNLGGELFPWTAAPPLATLVTGIAVLIGFAVYEWKGISTGILHHNLFGRGRERGQTFSICVGLIFIEAVLLFSYILFYPVM